MLVVAIPINHSSALEKENLTTVEVDRLTDTATANHRALKNEKIIVGGCPYQFSTNPIRFCNLKLMVRYINIVYMKESAHVTYPCTVVN